MIGGIFWSGILVFLPTILVRDRRRRLAKRLAAAAPRHTTALRQTGEIPLDAELVPVADARPAANNDDADG